MSTLAVLLVASAAAADGVYRCRWQPGTTAVEYSASDEADVRALLQGAQLVDSEGRPPSFGSLSSKRPEARTAPLYCESGEPEPADGLLELTFSRRVSFGVAYALAKCQLFYRCAPPAADGGRVAPQRRLLLSPERPATGSDPAAEASSAAPAPLPEEAPE